MTDPQLTLYYDAKCHLCDGTVQFLIKRDPDGLIRYCPLQSQKARADLAPFGVQIDLDTIYVVAGIQLFDRSSAALKLLQKISWPWPLTGLFWVVPKVIRDAVYGYVGDRRYRWFGQADHCLMPGADHSDRFTGLDTVDNSMDKR